jgi:hypothetical protein
MHCPKCDADISDSYQVAEPDVGIMSGGWYCDACDIVVGDEDGPEPHDDDVVIFNTSPGYGGAGGAGSTNVSDDFKCKFCGSILECGYGLAGGGGIGPYMYCPSEICGKTLIKSKDNS